MRTPLTLLFTLVLFACGGEPTTIDDAGANDARARPDVGVEGPDAGQELQPCAPPLAFTANSATVLPFDLYTATATGGSGAYRFRLSDDQSGAHINALTGAYLSGEQGGVQDIIEVTDIGCLGSATLTVRVVEPMDVRPQEVEGPPSIAFRFMVTKGSGSFRFSSVLDGTGGTLNEMTGDYQAGPNAGMDIVRVEDLESGELFDATIRIVPGAVLRPAPSRIYFPVGTHFKLRIDGGSGFFNVVADNPVVTYTDGELIGTAPGRANLSVTDAFTGQTTSLRADSIGPANFEQRRAGDAEATALALAAGDLNGDGKPDVILASSEADIEHVNSGAVFVYSGNGVGLNAAPAQIISGSERGDEFGHGIALADIDGDGKKDLIAGVLRADIRTTDSGAVRVYRGVANGFFEDEPAYTISGRNAYDYFGWSVTACDFNGDGLVDIAAGAGYAEDNDRVPIYYDQGAVFIFLGYNDGFRDDPDQVLWGDVLQPDGSFQGVQYLHFGTSLASGDFDGDGACDLAAGTSDYSNAAPNDGLLYLFKGRLAEMGNNGGLYSRPARGFVGTDPNDSYNGFTRRMAMGDLDGDGRPELAVGHTYYDHDGAGGADNDGAVRVWRSGPLAATPLTAHESITGADWSWVNPEAYEQAGYGVSIEDADGDLRNDLLVTVTYDEVTSATPTVYETGAVQIFSGQPGMMPYPTPNLTYGSIMQYGRFGAATAVIGDADGDAVPDLFVFADLESRYGIVTGTPYFVTGSVALATSPLELPGVPSGARAGSGIDIVGDVTGDGFDDLVLGATGFDHPIAGLEIGGAFLYRGTPSGFELEPAMTFQFFRGNGQYDYLGWDVARAGDFDGDRVADFAVLGAYVDRPNPFPAGVLPDASCAGLPYTYDTGAVFLFRGSAGLPASEPAFILYGIDNTTFEVAGGFDFDHDGYSDIALASPYWDRSGVIDTGGMAIYRGRPASPGGETIALCAPDFVFHGRSQSDYFGWSIAAIGDVDGDGCDEVAAGAMNEELGTPNLGAAHVIFGAGPACASLSPRMITLPSALQYSQAGWSVAGGEDITGDGYPDLVVGLPNFYNATAVPGSAVLVTSEYLRAVTPETFVEGAFPTAVALLRNPNDTRAVQIFGELNGERFGQSVALVRTPEGGAIAAGSPAGNTSGVPLSGGIGVFHFDPATGLSPRAGDLFGGETEHSGGQFGERINAKTVNGRGMIAVGAAQASGIGLDQGTGYVIGLGP